MRLGELLQYYAGKSNQSDKNEQKEPLKVASAPAIEKPLAQPDLDVFTEPHVCPKESSEFNIITKQSDTQQIGSIENQEDLPPASCYACKGTRFWRLKSGGTWVCVKCHPPIYGPDKIEMRDNNKMTY